MPSAAAHLRVEQKVASMARSAGHASARLFSWLQPRRSCGWNAGEGGVQVRKAQVRTGEQGVQLGR